DIELRDRPPAVVDHPPRQHFQPLKQRARLGSSMGFNEADDDVRALGLEAPRALQHGVSFPNARRGAEEHLQPAPGLPAESRQERVWVGASVLWSSCLRHRLSSVVMTILADPAPNSAPKYRPTTSKPRSLSGIRTFLRLGKCPIERQALLS